MIYQNEKIIQKIPLETVINNPNWQTDFLKSLQSSSSVRLEARVPTPNLQRPQIQTLDKPKGVRRMIDLTAPETIEYQEQVQPGGAEFPSPTPNLSLTPLRTLHTLTPDAGHYVRSKPKDKTYTMPLDEIQIMVPPRTLMEQQVSKTPSPAASPSYHSSGDEELHTRTSCTGIPTASRTNQRMTLHHRSWRREKPKLAPAPTLSSWRRRNADAAPGAESKILRTGASYSPASSTKPRCRSSASRRS